MKDRKDNIIDLHSFDIECHLMSHDVIIFSRSPTQKNEISVNMFSFLSYYEQYKSLVGMRGEYEKGGKRKRKAQGDGNDSKQMKECLVMSI